MNVKQQRNLIRVALYLLKGKSPVNFDMEMYILASIPAGKCHHFGSCDQEVLKGYKHINECGTSCCFAGHGPLALGTEDINEDTTWEEYVHNTFGVGFDYDVFTRGQREAWEFLFDGSNPNDPRKAAFRAAVFLETRKVPMYYDYGVGEADLKPEKLIKRLRKLQRSKLKDIPL